MPDNFNLMDELEKGQPEEFINFVRINSIQFHYLSTLVTPILRRKDTNWRKAILGRMKLTITATNIKNNCFKLIYIIYLY